MQPRQTRVHLGKPNKETHTWQPFRRIWATYSMLARISAEGAGGEFVTDYFALDPFARDCEWCYPYTNDINPNTGANYNLDAEDFIDILQDKGKKFQIAILDPPFSDRQSKETYGTSNLYASDSGKLTRISRKMGNLIVNGGYIIKAGYNSNSPHKGFELVEVCLCTLGGVRNDVIFSVWKKTTGSILTWGEEE